MAGCSRFHYLSRADRDAYGIVAEKSAFTPWSPPAGFDIVPDPRSRLFDPTPIDDPLLPVPAPQLYKYQLPDPIGPSRREPLPAPPEFPPPVLPPPADEQLSQNAPAVIQLASYSTAGDEPLVSPVTSGVRAAFDGTGVESRSSAVVHAQAIEEPLPAPGALPEIQLTPVPIPETAWERIPQKCTVRMFEFASLRDEFAQSFGHEPTAEQRDPCRKLTLENIVELALLNSREYQTQKELLYRAALRLTFERYRFDLKFSGQRGTNSAEIDYRHTRTQANGTVNTLSLPSTLQADKVLLTGGDLIARLANDIVLTFDGPDGFTSDLSSELFAQVSQTVFQRDIRFELLTQGERNVVYAARDFARFRKILFTSLAEQYYNLLRTYRQVEIDSLNYFTLVRALAQGREEFRVGLVPRVQVDQIEQNSLSALISLIGTCNRLERDLDRLKLRIGLPTETRINLDLSELEGLTLGDEIGVASQLVQRVRDQLLAEAALETPDRARLLETAIELIVRMQESFNLTRRLGGESIDFAALARLQARLRVDAARLRVRERRIELAIDSADPTAPAIRLLLRNLELAEALLQLLDRQHDLGEIVGLPETTLMPFVQAREELAVRVDGLQAQIDEALVNLELDSLAPLVDDAEQVRADAEQAVRDADQALGLDSDALIEEVELQATLEQVEGLLEQSGRLLQRVGEGLAPVEISVDDAMLTALVLRIDLMNERGFLADDWRHIKLAGDALRSILNFSASQTLEDFNFEESETRLRMTFDAPLNRRAERNLFREALIDYQVARRALMEQEDQIKFAVRNDLRNLSLSREQYDLGVASAALAFERVASTRLQLRLGVAGVKARDFLEAQTAYVSALSTVASRHIEYILGRTQLFLDLELMQVDGFGFWPELYDEQFQPTPVYQPPTGQYLPYGDLAPDVHYSRRMRRMLNVPFGEPAIFDQP
jgi:outer membrane protein TolC